MIGRSGIVLLASLAAGIVACGKSSESANTGNAAGGNASHSTTGGTSNSPGGSSNAAAGGSTGVAAGSPSGGAAAGGVSNGTNGGAHSIPGAGGTQSTAGAAGSTGGAGDPGNPGGSGGGPGATPDAGVTQTTCDELPGLVAAYKTAHPGNGGKDWDINAKTAAELAADPDAQRLRALCGDGQLPVIPEIAWEYGGADHPWINPAASALAYCVYIPVVPATDHWAYDAQADHVTADVSVLCPDQNPCKAETGAAQVMSCLGDNTNIEILVDTASLNDGTDVGLDVSNASTDLYLIPSDGSPKVHLYTGL